MPVFIPIRHIAQRVGAAGLDSKLLESRNAAEALYRLRCPNNKTSRVIRLIRMLEESERGLNVSEITQRLSVDSRTVKRYLSDLGRMRFDLMRVATGRRYLRYRLKGGSPGICHWPEGGLS